MADQQHQFDEQIISLCVGMMATRDIMGEEEYQHQREMACRQVVGLAALKSPFVALATSRRLLELGFLDDSEASKVTSTAQSLFLPASDRCFSGSGTTSCCCDGPQWSFSSFSTHDFQLYGFPYAPLSKPVGSSSRLHSASTTTTS